MKKNILSSFLLLISLLLSNTCSTTDPKLEPDLKLELKDISCTEAWLQLTTNNIQLPATINFLINNNVAQTFSLSTQDFLLYIDSLLPNQSYKFKIVLNSTNNPQTTTNEVLAQTLDTTSHNFTFETFTFGEHSSSTLYDVAIINENDIWAVGEIYMNDSLGNPEPMPYNAVHWNGQSWELKKINMLSTCNPVTYPPLKAIWAFSENNIVITSGGSIGWFDGTNIRTDCTIRPLLTGSINKLWGSSSNDLYAVGNNGNIAHYNGSSWTKIESGTTSIINDTWGITNQQNKTIVYCAVSSFFVEDDKKILKLIDGKVDSVNWNRDVRLYSAWSSNENFLYVCGEGVFVYKLGTWTEINLPSGGKNSIRGIDINDILIDGDNGFIAHYNGSTWQTYNNNYLKGYSRLDFKGNIVAIAGNNQGRAIVEIGRRN